MIITLCLIMIAALGAAAFLNQRSFGRLPKGERLERIKASTNYHNGEFKNLQPTALMTSKQNRLTNMLKFLFADRSSTRPDKPIEVERSNLHTLSPSQDCIIWFGHSSYLMQIDGLRYLVDPVFCMASPVKFVNRPFKGSDIYKPEDMPNVDYLIITHDHWDHLDYRTVMALKDRIGHVVCPLGVGEHFEYWGFDKQKLIELDWSETAVSESGPTIYCLPSRHFSGRGLKSNQTLWASFMIESGRKRIFIAGDGGYGDHLAKIGKQFKTIDLAILENGQYNEKWKNIHLMPELMKPAVEELGAETVLTVHHSKYALSEHPWDEPLRNAKHLAEELADKTILRPRIGEIVNLDFCRQRMSTEVK